ncbi:molecular chaperone DnaJ [Erythrobacter ani]|uniref:Molecular chaperone DnaJ n=1 Tax=Erythrobacter ani TaxID=2827235 RepID=A0ABS6SMN6_9SPHN|nr:molecular chaperone DnaJ [Erythrobacter ani]MBV7265747.1 molecular chaperone DnaJ [Erythrobacter ani]
MFRIAIILIILTLLFRWAFGKWPWQTLGTKPTRQQEIRRARELLKIEAGASRDDILAAHKRLMATVHPDKGGSNGQVHDANDARDLLLSELPDGDTGIGRDEHS